MTTIRSSSNRLRQATVAASILLCPSAEPHLLAADVVLPPKKPNIVIIVADDFRADWMGNAGRTFMDTPQLDRLAAEGMRFRNAFAASGVCSPSRASMLTGKYAHRASAPDIGLVNNSFLITQTTFMETLQEAGYRTALIGKWHLGNEEKPPRGFEHWASFTFVGDYFNPVFWINGKRTPMQGFSDDLISKMAADWIRAQPDKGPPFCLIVGLKAPHLPFTPPERMKERLLDTEFEEPVTYNERKPGLKDTLLKADTFSAAIKKHGNFQEWLRAYSQLSLTLDESVGIIVGALHERGVLDRTFLAFTSDQGYSLGEFGLCEKHFPYEQVMRVPMLVRFPPLIQPGTVSDKMVLIPDIAPTVLDLAGAPVPKGLDGRSWLPLLRGENPAWREDFFFDFWHYEKIALPAMAAVRTERYKLIEYQLSPLRELYDLEKDPHEANNLYGVPEMAEIQADMEARLARLKKETDWSAREVKPLESFYLLGPVPAERTAAVGHSLSTAKELTDVRIDDTELSWRHITRGEGGAFQLDGLSAGDNYFLAVPLERLTDYDPYVTLEFFRVGPPTNGRRQQFPLAALFDGETIWQNQAYRALSVGNSFEQADASERFHELFNQRCNYPLPGKRGLAIFRGVMPADLGSVDAEIVAPAAALGAWKGR